MKNNLVYFVMLCMFFSITVKSQEETSNFKPKYVTITTLHGAEGVDVDAWLKTEQEYFDKVTSKINLLVKHEVLVSYFSDDLEEIKVINVYNSWGDIEKVNEVRAILIDGAWPNEKEQEKFFEKQNSFYTNYHSDEIFLTSNHVKRMTDADRNSHKDSFIFYMNTNILSSNANKESDALYKEYVNEVIQKNAYIKSYATYRHHWGDDSREFVELFTLNSLEDFNAFKLKNKELLELYIPKEEKRKKFKKTYDKAVLSQTHEMFFNIPSLSKW